MSIHSLFRQKIATLQKELESVRFALIGKTDQLQETQRKLYTATNTSEKHRNESLRAKLKLDELKNKFEAGMYISVRINSTTGYLVTFWLDNAGYNCSSYFAIYTYRVSQKRPGV